MISQVKAAKGLLLASTVLAGAVAMGGVALAQPVAAGQTNAPVAGGQTGSAPGGAISSPSNTPQATADSGAQGGQAEVVVTGSILRRSLAATDAPLTVNTAVDLQNRGITTVANAVQDLAANGAAALPNSFTANGAFAAGASAASLRGLTTNSTLTLVDGLRVAYYPLADDGTRNFVDLNTIPDIIIDRVETLKDGASSTYGADAIAGVVNIITKKTFQGVEARAEGGFSQHGGGGENNVQFLGGVGDLNRDGYNLYIGLEYEHDLALNNRDRGYPYNTADLSRVCGVSLVDGSRTCATNQIRNGLQFDGSFLGLGNTTVPGRSTGTTVAVVRPYTPNADGSFTAAGDYRLLAPAAGCGALRPITVTTAASGGLDGFSGPVNLCQQDFTNQFGEISPDDKRFSSSLRFTKQINSDTQFYAEANYYQNKVFSHFSPSSIRDRSTPGPLGLPNYSTALSPGIVLPVYVCSSGQSCATATDRQLNPNNPFAGLGEVAQINYNFGDIPNNATQFSQSYRLAAGITGSFDLFGKWNYSVDATGSQIDLKSATRGDIYIQGLLQAVATGAYNFANPSANTQAVRSLISPEVDQYSRSQLAQLQVNLSRELFQLPGGMAQLGLFGSTRYEAIYNPSANTDANGQLNRFFTINPFGVIGHRTTEAGGFEVDLPILKQIEINGSGRYDSYSTGASSFSPKVGGRIRPFADWAPAFDRITLRSTWSEGFRIPSFAEANAFPTTGFVTSNAPASFLAQHTVNGKQDGYGVGYSLGETLLANPNLQPEKSENFTAGIVIEPLRNLSISLDYYRIKKTNFITPNTSQLGAAIAAYYAGTALPAGYTAVAGDPDPNLPNAKPTLGFISYGFTNLGTETTDGYDIGATARFNLPFGIKYTSVFDGNYVLRLNLDPQNGNPVQHYAGTIGPYNDVAAGGTPKFRANWANTFSYGPVSFTATAYYTDGYKLQAEDFGDTTGVCIANGASASAINSVFLDGVTPIACKVKPFWDVDLHASYQVFSYLQLYMDVQNLADRRAPFDPTTYGGVDYNSTFANRGIYGRYFKFGVRASF